MDNYDLIGIGIGPFNLGLAALLDAHDEVNSLFLEAKPAFSWHAGLLLSDATLQVPFLADLVTMIAPTHPLSYLNYLHEGDRLYKFYYYESFQIPRREYDDYCRWAANKLPACRFDARVTAVTWEQASERFIVESRAGDGEVRRYACRDVAIGIGTSPYLPAWANVRTRAPIVHSAQFIPHRAALEACRRVTVVGSGQSAAECVLALCQALTPERIAAGAAVQWITRTPGFHPMESSKLGQECFTPAYMAYFQTLSREKRREVAAGQGGLYKGISYATIGRIFDALYEGSIGGRDPGLLLLPNCEVEQVLPDPGGDALRVSFRHRGLGQTGHLDTDAIVAATGYHHATPDWLAALKQALLETDARGDCLVDDRFIARRRDAGAGRIFVQNAEIFQQGIGSPDLGLGAYRNGSIVNSLLGREHYRLPRQSAFQHFGLPAGARAEAE